nr:hypothetical protein [Tanacetum cinerariifolium]
MEQSSPTLAKILILDTGKFEQWKFRIQQYLQHEHYALWEVIKFGDSYEAPQQESATASASEGSAKKKGRTVAFTTKDMQKRRNDVKARTTLLLALPDEHQLRFSKYKTAQELWAAILKTFGGNEATKKTKKNMLKQFWKKTGKKISIQGTDMAGFDKSKTRFKGRRTGSQGFDGVGWDWSFMANEEENHALVADEKAPTEFALMAKSSFDNKSQRSEKNKEGLGYSVVPPPPSQVYSPPKKDMSWT